MKSVQGHPPVDDGEDRAYLLKNLEEIRRDCQWLLGLGAASVFGVLIEKGFVAAPANWRMATALVSLAQIAVAMVGAISWSMKEVDPAGAFEFLTKRYLRRQSLRNVALVLLAISFALIVTLAWLYPTAQAPPNL